MECNSYYRSVAGPQIRQDLTQPSKAVTHFPGLGCASYDPVSTPTGQHISSPREQKLFVRPVARCWLLCQALINGHQHWKAEANQAEAALLSTIAADDKLAELATQLMQLLDATGHTSSLVENINGILKSFLYSRQSFRNLETLQAYLNLFTLWHNMRVYERGKRQGSSPCQLADNDR